MLNGYSENGKYIQKTPAKITIKGNYHTHNYLCGHAGGTVSEYAAEAVKYGLIELGISDHCRPPIGSGESYMTPSTLGDAYLPQFDEARQKYGAKLKIFSGAEVEYVAGYADYYARLLSRLDYLVLGQHEFVHDRRICNTFTDGVTDEHILAYFDNVIAGLKSGYFALLAHPDVIFYSRREPTPRVKAGLEEVVVASKACNIPIELNANGIRNHGFRYPTDLLVELCKKHNAKVMISSDAHTPVDLCDSYVTDLYAYALDNGLNIAYTLDIK